MSLDIRKNYSRNLFGLNSVIRKIIKDKRDEINELIEKYVDYKFCKNMRG